MAVPTWLTAIPPRSWGAIASSSLSSSGVMHTSGDQVIDAWGGAIVVTGGVYIGATFTTGTFLVCWGGGHTNYSGNEVYAFGPFESNTPVWNRLRDATSPAPTDVNVDGSGNPSSRHTYSCLSYVNSGSLNWLLSVGALYTYSASLGFTTLYVYDFNQVSPNSNQPWSLKTAGSGASDCTVYDSTLNRVWYHINGENSVCYYDVAADTHTRSIYKSPPNFGNNAASCIDTVRGIWAIWEYTNGISFYRTNNGVANDYYFPTVTGPKPTPGNGSIIYDPVDDVIKLWIGEGRKLWTLAPPPANPYQNGNAWTWSVETVPFYGATPNTQSAQGTFGRFNYLPGTDIRGYVLLNSATGSVYFYNATKEAMRPGFSTFPINSMRR